MTAPSPATQRGHEWRRPTSAKVRRNLQQARAITRCAWMTTRAGKTGMALPIRAPRSLLRNPKISGASEASGNTKRKHAMELTPLHHALAAHLGRELTPEVATVILLQATDTTDRSIDPARFEPVAHGAIVIGVECFDQVLPEFHPLHLAHWQEASHRPDGPAGARQDGREGGARRRGDRHAGDGRQAHGRDAGAFPRCRHLEATGGTHAPACNRRACTVAR